MNHRYFRTLFAVLGLVVLAVLCQPHAALPTSAAADESRSGQVGQVVVRKHYFVDGRPVAQRLVRQDGQTAADSSDLHYILTDHLGSPRTIVDRGGETTAVGRYMPFGEAVAKPPRALSSLGFTGHVQQDDGVGLIYMNARHFAPGIGRFVSADTLVPDLTRSQPLNRYAYVDNNPIRYRDPSGHCKNAGFDAQGEALYECLADDGTFHVGPADGRLYQAWYGRMQTVWRYLSEQASGDFDAFVAWALDGGLFFYDVAAADLSLSSGGNNMMGYGPLYLYDESGDPSMIARRNGQAIYHVWSNNVTDYGLNQDGESLIVPLADLSAAQADTLAAFMRNAEDMTLIWNRSGVRIGRVDVRSVPAFLNSVLTVVPDWYSNWQEGKQRLRIAHTQFSNTQDGLSMSGHSLIYSVHWSWQGFSPYTNTSQD